MAGGTEIGGDVVGIVRIADSRVADGAIYPVLDAGAIRGSACSSHHIHYSRDSVYPAQIYGDTAGGVVVQGGVEVIDGGPIRQVSWGFQGGSARSINVATSNLPITYPMAIWRKVIFPW